MISKLLEKLLQNYIAQQRPTSRYKCTPSMSA